MKYVKISAIIPNSSPPFFIGSQIRGAFGYALKRVVCINPSFRCEECFAKKNCLFHEAYEQKNGFHPYRFDFALGMNCYDFSLYLFENFAEQLPYFLSVLHQMISKIGFGKDRKTYKEFKLYINDESCFVNNEIKIPKNYIKEFETDGFCPDILVRFVTPLRLKKKNSFLRSGEIELFDIINSIYQRSLKLQAKDYKKLPFTPNGKIAKRELSFKDLTRYSNRQKTKMKLGGLIGEIEIKGLDKESYGVLKMGEIVAVGKQTVFGLGKIKMKDLE